METETCWLIAMLQVNTSTNHSSPPKKKFPPSHKTNITRPSKSYELSLSSSKGGLGVGSEHLASRQALTRHCSPPLACTRLIPCPIVAPAHPTRPSTQPPRPLAPSRSPPSPLARRGQSCSGGQSAAARAKDVGGLAGRVEPTDVDAVEVGEALLEPVDLG